MQTRLIRTLLLLLGLSFGQLSIGQVNLNLDTKEVAQDEIVCVDITVENFQEILALQFSINWDPAVLQFVRTDNFGINIVPSDFNTNVTNEGKLAFLWIDPLLAGQSIDDGQILFSVCFRGIGASGTTSSVRITSDPTDANATNGMDETLTIDSNPGEVMIAEDIVGANSVEVFYDNVETAPGESFCIPLRLRNADKMSVLQFTVVFNPTVLRYDRRENTNSFEGGAFPLLGDNLKNDGILTYSVIIFDEAGANIEDGTALVDLCFTVIGDNQCISEMLMIGDSPTEALHTKAPNDQEDVGVIWNPGKINFVDADQLSFTNESVTGVTCIDPDNGSIVLDVVGGTSTPKYLWNTGATTKNLINVTAGNYFVSVTDECRAIDTLKGSYVVGMLGEIPTASAGDDLDLVCEPSQLTLDGTASSTGANISFQWSGLDGQTIDGGLNTTGATVSEIGRYELLVTDTSNGCFETDTVVVNDIRVMPMAEAGTDMNIQCEDDFITLTGSGSAGAEFRYDWSTADGNIIETNGTDINVDQPGTYILEVVHLATGCSTISEVMVTGNNNQPLAAISGSTMLNCSQPTLTLNANNGGGAIANYSYNWSTTNGNITEGENTVEAIISEPGDYQISVVDTGSGCSAVSSITIEANFDGPTVTSPEDDAIDCANEQRTLTAMGSTTANTSYQWTLIEGSGQVLSGGGSATAEVMGPGKYEIVASSSVTGCSARDTTEIILNGDLLLAELGDDYDACETETILIGNADSEVTGRWTVLAGEAVLEDPVDQNSRVNNMSEGVNSFLWTLSSDACPEYSSDTININLVPAPIAQDDSYEVTQGFGSLEIDLLNNDQITDRENAIVTLLSMPTIGTLTETGNGIYTYAVENPNASGTITFTYEVCDDLCSMNCGMATVEITIRSNMVPVQPDPVSTEPQSLGITPNGDGLNETLVFDELLNEPDRFQTKRLIVYNRWGDIVHEAQPYNNDWGGTNQNGNLLPQGTYYFVMQLDIGSGYIIEGDVTILE